MKATSRPSRDTSFEAEDERVPVDAQAHVPGRVAGLLAFLQRDLFLVVERLEAACSENCLAQPLQPESEQQEADHDTERIDRHLMQSRTEAGDDTAANVTDRHADPGERRAPAASDADREKSVRTIVDYPKPGIMFRDITTLLADARAFRRAVDELVNPWAGNKIDKVAGMEARGFIIGGAVAHQLSAGFVPIRKKGKLPHTTVRIAYSLEYGIDEMEMHVDAIQPGERVILVDDLIATGGTAEGAVKLLRQIGANVVAACFIVDLPELGGAAKLRAMDIPVRTLMTFDGH